ncbi:hypothetical protein [Spirosoma oryzae]|uniref:hypothetical protein n=1 Tax=Spirosoma oryzae TaxID=1469603 RepID=UPI000D06F3C1|nr:hypothetical protein [Spirosoma oryzae]
MYTIWDETDYGLWAVRNPRRVNDNADTIYHRNGSARLQFDVAVGYGGNGGRVSAGCEKANQGYTQPNANSS